MKNYQNLITAGCSFTWDGGIGGVPPTHTSTGGCSYIHGSYIYSRITWPGFLAKKMNVNSLVNLAINGHGNLAASNSILQLINRFPYRSDNTLVVLNLTDPARFDVPCSFDDPNQSSGNVTWTSDLIPHTYLNRLTPNNDVLPIVKKMGIDQVELLTSNQVEFLFSLLEFRHIDFYFLTMMNYLDHKYLGPVLQKFQHRLIDLDPGTNMYNFCQATKTYRSENDAHPSKEGHLLIANAIYEKIFS